MNLEKAQVTVVMPVYNAEKYLRQSIESILNQTHVDFIFMIINDGSTDDSEKIILSFNDKRMQYLKNESNKGLIYTLNKGLGIVHTDYVVRMDADDIALPHRIEKQLEFMEQHPDVAVSGSQIQYFGNNNDISTFPLDHELLKSKLIFTPCICHPASIIRTSVIKNNNLFYDPNYLLIEDYEYWIRISNYGRLANLPEVLLKYRWEGQNITANNWSTRENRYKSIYQKLLNELNIDPTDENLTLHLELAFNTLHIGNVNRIHAYKNRLLKQNKVTGVYPERAFNKIINEAWNKLFFKVIENGLAQTSIYWFFSKSITIAQLQYFIGFYLKKLKLR